MSIRAITATLFLAAAAPAFAGSVVHSANTEMGYTAHPEHAQPGKSRSDVIAEMEQSKKDGSWAFHRFGAPVPVKGGALLTRDQVLAELDRAQKHPSWSARRVGASVTMP